MLQVMHKVPTRRFDSGMELLPPGTTPQSSSQGLVGLSPVLAVQLLFLRLLHLFLRGFIPILVLGLGRLQQMQQTFCSVTLINAAALPEKQ